MEEAEPGSSTQDRICKLDYPILASLDDDDALLDNDSYAAAISEDGTRVLFVSVADFVSSDENGDLEDLFVRDLVDGTTIHVSVNDAGDGPSGASLEGDISGDGQLVALSAQSSTFPGGSQFPQIYLRDLSTSMTTLVSQNTSGGANDVQHIGPRISTSGEYVVFFSSNANLVAGDPNFHEDIFVWPVSGGPLTFATPPTANEHQLPVISGDGSFIVYQVPGSNPPALLLVDWMAGTDPVPLSSGLFHDVSSGGKFVTAQSYGATPSAYYFDVALDDATTLAASSTRSATISDDGRRIAFSTTVQLVGEDTDSNPDIYVFDRIAGTYELVSVRDDGGHLSSFCSDPKISADGNYVTFDTGGVFVDGDTNGSGDVYVAEVGDDNHPMSGP
jgi:Tol biopolymer transport system component